MNNNYQNQQFMNGQAPQGSYVPQNQPQGGNQQLVERNQTPQQIALNTAFKQAQMYAGSTIVPKEYQQNPSNCFIAIEMANRMGANPFQVMQSLNIIQGRPSWSSQFIIAAINQSRRFKTQLNYKISGNWSDGTFKCIAYATANDGTYCESIAITKQLADAEGWTSKNGSKWKTMPELMARYRAASFFGKQYCPDILMGIMTTEEQADVVDVAPIPINQDTKHKNIDEVTKDQNDTNGQVKVNVNLETGEVKEEVKQSPTQEITQIPDFDLNDDWTKAV